MPDAGLPRPPPEPERVKPGAWWICGLPRCDRPLILGVHDDEIDDWLIIFREDMSVVCRCPRHHTRKVYRRLGMRWARQERLHARIALRNDLERYPHHVPGAEVPLPPSRFVWDYLMSRSHTRRYEEQYDRNLLKRQAAKAEARYLAALEARRAYREARRDGRAPGEAPPT